MFHLTTQELHQLKRLSTPAKIQDFLNTLPFNFELQGDTCQSPRHVLRSGTAHCLEGAMLAAVALRLQGHKPLLMDLKSINGIDDDHVAALFKLRGRWGCITKTNHAVLRYREPIYLNLRELAMSFFHEYFLHSGRKTLRSYSAPFDLSKFDHRDWITSDDDVFYIPQALDRSKHFQLMTPAMIRGLRSADPVEIAYGKIVEWNKNGKGNFTSKKK
jgi:hypothetical protein